MIPEYHEKLIERFKADLITTTGEISSSRDNHINSSLHYLSHLSPELHWETMNNNEARELYGKFLMCDLADSTRALRSRYIVTFLKYLCEEKINTQMEYAYICKFKTHKAKPPVIKESDIFSEKKVAEILALKRKNGKDVLPLKMKAIIGFLFGGGMRVGEVCRLRMSDVTLKEDIHSQRKYYRVSVDDQKTQKMRTTIINREYLLEVISKYIESVKDSKNEYDYLFSDKDKPLGYDYVRHWCRVLKEKYGYTNFTSHKGRKHNISRRVASGEPISSVSMTTHGSPNAPALKHYLHLNEQDIVESVMKYS